MQKKWFTFFLILLCSFEMAFAGTISQIGRLPASITHDIEIGELEKRIEGFKVRIAGKDLEAECNTKAADVLEEVISDKNQSEEVDEEIVKEAAEDEYAGYNVIKQKEDEFQQMLAKIKKNACGDYRYTYDDVAKEEVQECKPGRQKGLIEQWIDTTMQLEKDEKEPPKFKLSDPRIRSLHDEAVTYRQEVRKYLYETELKDDRKRLLLQKYLDGVALPMRDLIVVKRAYIPNEYDGVHFYMSLLPEIPTSLFPEDNIEARQMITLGPNPSTEPFHLVIEDRKWGRSRLRYHRTRIMQRDIVKLLKAPTVKNYIRSMKWMTLHMMFSQVFIYDTILGNKAPLRVPESCQSHFNGDLPPEFNFEFREGQGESFVDGILSNHGLLMSLDNQQFVEYYMENIDNDPLKDGYSGLAPFEEYKYAKQGLESKDKRKYVYPDIDDFSQYQSTIQLKMNEALEVFKDETSSYFGLRDSRKYTWNGSQLFEKILATPSEVDLYQIELKDGGTEQIVPARQNLSVYLAELMQRSGVMDVRDLVTESLETKYKDRKVKIDFPSLHGASIWRQWAAGTLAEFLAEQAETKFDSNSKLGWAIKNACSPFRFSQNPRLKAICNQNDPNDVVKKLAEEMNEFTVSHEYIPLRRLEEKKYIDIFPLLGRVWQFVRDRTEHLEVAKPDELEFLLTQMEANNPWARIRFSYIIAMEELEAFREGAPPRYIKHPNGHQMYNNHRFCFYNNVNSIISKMKEAGNKLKISTPITISHGNKLLDEDEKEYVWNQVVENTNDQNSQIFMTKYGNKEAYKYLEDISYKTFLTKDSVEEYTSKELPYGLNSDKMKEIDEFMDTKEGKQASFLYDLYKERGNLDKQTEMFEKHASKHGLDDTFSAKLNFLIMDSALKRPVMHEVIKGAAQNRKMKILQRLDEFCKMEMDDHEKLKTLFYATAKAQNKVNELAGAPSIPKEVMEKIDDKINSMSAEEWTDVWLGVGAGLLGIAAILIGGACTGITGGLCAPLGVAMMVAGASAMAMQMSLVNREFDRKKNADIYERQVKDMEALGYTGKGAADNVSRSWFWTVFETICIIPLIGVVSRSVKVGSKLTYVSGKVFLTNVGKQGFRQSWRLAGQAGKMVVTEADVAFAKVVLGLEKGVEHHVFDGVRTLDDFGKNLLKNGISKEQVTSTVEGIKKLKSLFASGKISGEAMAKGIARLIDPLRITLQLGKEGAEYVSKVVVKESIKEINEQTAKTVSRYWGDSPKAMLKFFGSYSKKLDKAIKVMDAINEGKTYIGKIPVAGRVINWVRKLRLEHLAQNADKIRKLERGLTRLAANGGDLEQYILKNIDDFTDIFIKIPMRRREIPYVFLLQGGPHIGGPLMGKRAKFISALADGIIMRKFFNARSRLVYESAKSRAREVLGFAKNVASEKTYFVFKAFQESVAEAVEEMPTQSHRTRLLNQYKRLEEVLAAKLYHNSKETIDNPNIIQKLKQALFKGDAAKMKAFTEMNEETIKRVLFNPSNAEERAIGQVLWESLPVDDLFDLREVGDIAYRVVKKLSNYDRVGKFNRFLNALKVIVIKRDPGVVELM